MKRILLTKNFLFIALAVLLICAMGRTASASGLFGPLQTISRQDGGLNTAIGYWYHEDTYQNGTDHVVRQNQIYSQAAYGANNIWEIYARVGISDLKIFDAFSSSDASTTTNKNDFKENWTLFGTLGAKAFYPINKIFGIGAFVQGTYYFRDFTDEISGISGVTPFTTELKVKNFWDVHCGAGLQITIPRGIKLYAGPYVYYSEAKMSMLADIPGLEYSTVNTTMRSKAVIGGFTGVDIPLIKGFHLNIEGQYSDRFSAGAAISFTY